MRAADVESCITGATRPRHLAPPHGVGKPCGSAWLSCVASGGGSVMSGLWERVRRAVG